MMNGNTIHTPCLLVQLLYATVNQDMLMEVRSCIHVHMRTPASLQQSNLIYENTCMAENFQ